MSEKGKIELSELIYTCVSQKKPQQQLDINKHRTYLLQIVCLGAHDRLSERLEQSLDLGGLQHIVSQCNKYASKKQ